MYKWIKNFIKKQIADWKAYCKEHEGDFIGPDGCWWRS